MKIYIELDQFPTSITKDNVEVAFEEWSIKVNVTDADGALHVLDLKKLCEKIEVDKSTWRFSEGKRISVTLKKWLETKWTSLLKGGDKK